MAEAMTVWLLGGSMFATAVAGVLFAASINYYRNSARMLDETRKLALRVLLKNKRT